MGLFSKPILESQVWFAGIQAYAESGDADVAILAQVEITNADSGALSGALPLLAVLGASRLLSLLRREPHYVWPFMYVVKDVAQGLDDADDLSAFSCRDHVVTDPVLLRQSAEVREEVDPATADEAWRTAEVNCGLPVTEFQLSGEAERSTSITLHSRKGAGVVEYKFRMGSANPLTTIGAWSATTDECARTQAKETFAVPAANGLSALCKIWQGLGCPPGLGVRESLEMDRLVEQAVLSRVPA